MSCIRIEGRDVIAPQGEVVLYESPNGEVRLDVRLEHDTVWLTQAQMGELFDRERSVITKHISNVFAEGELARESNVQNLHIASSDKPVTAYNLDVIISVGYCAQIPTRLILNLLEDNDG